MSTGHLDMPPVSYVRSDTGRTTLGDVTRAARTTSQPSRAAALAAVSVPHAPQQCPGYDRPGTARERFRCPGCSTRYEHRGGRWQVLDEAP